MRYHKPLLSCVLIFCAALFLNACSSKDEPPPGLRSDVAQAPAEELYNTAQQALEAQDYAKAQKFFEEVERQHPYSEWSDRAQLMAAYAAYLAQDYEQAVTALDRYIQLHPGASDVDYAYYLKALCYYEQISDVRRDQDMTVQAFNALDVILRRFPNSQYRQDAQLKMDLTQDHLAGKEMEVGRYYLNRGHVNAAINRFRSVVLNYQTTTHVAEAMHRLVESYLTLGLRREALQVAAVLGHNYPGDKWYARSYALLDEAQRKELVAQRGFIERTVDSLLKPD